MRLDKYLANSKIGSRSEVKKYIKAKRVKVNNQIITKDNYQVTENDHIYFDNQEIIYEKYVYYMLNKPKGILSASRDNQVTTVVDLINDYHDDLFPIGRLDKDTTGLLIISNDGKLAHDLLSPRKHVSKIYHALVDGKVYDKDIQAFKEGIELKDFTCLPANLKVLEEYENQSLCEVTIQEGKFHQIKRMFQSTGKQVLELKRIQMGEIILDSSLKEGEYRPLRSDEINSLKAKSML